MHGWFVSGLNRFTGGTPVLLLMLGLVLGADGASAQRPLIAVLQSGEGSLYAQAVEGLTTELTRRGYRAGANIDYLVLTLKPGGREDPIETLLKRQPKVVVAVGTDATRALQQRYAKLPPDHQPPVVFLMVLDPVAEGLVERAERSGGRFVGVGLTIRPQRQFRLLLDVMPTAKRLGAIYNPDDTTSRRLIEQAQEDAQRMGLELLLAEARTPDELPHALSALEAEIDALWLIPDPVCAAPSAFEQMVAFCTRHKLPLLAFAEPYVRRGALVGIGVDFADQGAVAAELVDQLLQGADPATMPLMTPRRLRTYYNLATARSLGVTIPDTLLNLADGVFKQ